MKIRDALYGAFEIPDFLDRLVLAPEFRRLSEVRLININSASLAALADVRRYSHTLGVLRLALLNPLMGLGENELRAFFASIIIHDAGTPAFAHLFEYFLSERYDWNHELVLPGLLSGSHHPDRRLHQIFQSQRIAFEKLCQASKIEFDLVRNFAASQHPYSKLIFGSLDFDNLDNVARMNWMLGERFDVGAILSIARELGIGSHGELQLPRSELNNVLLWQRLRLNAYQILVFDEATVAAQAVLSKAIAEAMAAGDLSETDWVYDDHSLIRALESSPGAKRRIQDLRANLPMSSLLCVRSDELDRFDRLGRTGLIDLVEQFQRERFGSSAANYGYVFRDRGAFSKRVDFVDPNSGEKWSVGETSASIVFYGFMAPRLLQGNDPRQTGMEFREWIDQKIQS
jgi:HD superfamily phosphohydrolase